MSEHVKLAEIKIEEFIMNVWLPFILFHTFIIFLNFILFLIQCLQFPNLILIFDYISNDLKFWEFRKSNSRTFFNYVELYNWNYL